MKNRCFYLLGGLVAILGVPVCAQVLNPLPARVFGQYNLPKTAQELVSPPSTAGNLLEGRELSSPIAVAVDASTSPAMVYVVDAGNNRVLGWKDYSTYTNGAMADVVLGQKDLQGNLSYTGSALTSFGSGLNAPSAVAVDRNGNVFVMDAGNNRILRYPTPAVPKDGGGPIVADLVIGQANLTSNAANRGAATSPTEVSIRTNPNPATVVNVQLAGMAFDGAGNLWLADAGNHRLLRYPAADVSGPSNTGSDGASLRADYVLGQIDFNTATPNLGRASTINDRTDKLKLRYPNAVAFDASGNLFTVDDLARVLVFQPPFEAVGKAASRIAGIYSSVTGQPAPPAVNDVTFGAYVSGTTWAGGPRGLFTVGNYLFVCDTAFNRVVRFNPVSTWAAEGPGTYSPKMTAIYGQDDYTRAEPNGMTGSEPSSKYLDGPVGGAYLNGDIYLVDSRNNRVLINPYNPEWDIISQSSRILGQYDFPFRTANLIEGREFDIGSLPVSSTARVSLGIGMALDNTTPGAQRLYIADTANHRILGYSDVRKIQTGDRADLVIGQVDLFRSIVNSPGGDAQKTNASGLALPSAVLVDAQGNLWVADTGNGRVLRFPKPFENPGGPFVADRVIGQPDFTTRTDGVAARNRLYRPAGLAMTVEGNLVVSDIGHNRVLLYTAPFDYDAPDAYLVLGQPDFQSSASGNLRGSLNLPMGIAIDSSGRLYVADTLNARLSIFHNINGQTTGADAALLLPITGGQPLGVTVSQRTGQIYVSAGRVYRYLEFDQLATGSTGADSTFVMPAYGPRSTILDSAENLLVADSANRITMHYPQLTVVNGMNAFPGVAPSMYGLLRAAGVTFSTDGGSASGPELPKQLGDVEVLVNGVSAPLTQTDSENIRLIVPKSAPSSGPADFLVRRVSDSQTLAFSRISMTAVSPAVIFVGSNPGSTGQARAFNQDGAANSASNGASSGQELTVLLTGYGQFDGSPDDGLAPGWEVPIPEMPTAYLRVGTALTVCQVVSSTLDPDQPGVWRVKIKVPQVATNGSYGFGVLYKSVSSDQMTTTSQSVRTTVQVNH